MREVWIIDAVRTPIGRYGGALAPVRADDLAAVVLRGLVDRTGIDPGVVDDVILGCANQAGEDNPNVGRMASLLAGLPVEVPGQTVNRLCGSGLQAVHAAYHAILAGEGEVYLAGGVESMSRAPYAMLKATESYPRGTPEIADTALGWRFVNPRMPETWTVSLGETAERVAERYGVTREDQDAFAVESQRRADDARRRGAFDAELIPVVVRRRRGEELRVLADEHPRSDTTLEKLANLPPVFRESGTVTAGNSSGLNDGAAALLVMESSRARALGHRPLARIASTAVAGVEPDLMGMGPVPASERALKRAGVGIDDAGLAELNEAFAAQSVACLRALDLEARRVNVKGGAIALGHPLGCSGARILTTLVHALWGGGGGYGLATMCIGVGQGIATVVEGIG